MTATPDPDAPPRRLTVIIRTTREQRQHLRRIRALKIAAVSAVVMASVAPSPLWFIWT